MGELSGLSWTASCLVAIRVPNLDCDQSQRQATFPRWLPAVAFAESCVGELSHEWIQEPRIFQAALSAGLISYSVGDTLRQEMTHHRFPGYLEVQSKMCMVYLYCNVVGFLATR